MKNSKKGQAGPTAIIYSIGIGVVVIAVVAIMLGAFRDDTVTGASGCNATVKTQCGYDYNVTTRGLQFLDNATSKFGTAGTIVGVMFLLAVIGGGTALGVAGYRKLRG